MNIEPVTIPCRILQRCSTKRGMGILPNDQSGTSGGTRTHTLVKEADFESHPICTTCLFLSKPLRSFTIGGFARPISANYRHNYRHKSQFELRKLKQASSDAAS